jgi:hypothetical protein
MSLTIEDGTIVDGADSFATLADLVDYADKRGLTLPAGDGPREILLRKAADFLNTMEPQFKGSRVEASQPLCFPRENVYLYDSTEAEADDSIPSMLILAQCQLAFDAVAGELQVTGSGRAIKRQKVDVIETEYDGPSTAPQRVYTKAMGFLAPLLENSSGFALTTLRV